MARDTEWLNMADTLLQAMPERYRSARPSVPLRVSALAADVGAILDRCPELPTTATEPAQPVQFRGAGCGFQ